jgi:Family of unknown function (DUF5758)/MORN repeat variant
MKEVNLGYKAGLRSIITLEITGKTNENREDVVDALRAKFRTNKACVVDIENFQTGVEMKEDFSIHNDLFIYKVGKEAIEANYNEDINEVCAPGIHYFKTRKAAKSWWLKCDHIYRGVRRDGLHREWHENGRLSEEYSYRAGKLNGIYKRWQKDGSPSEECTFKNGIKNGLYKLWHDNGRLCEESNYKDRELDGVYKRWNTNGQLECERYFKNGELIYWSNLTK